VVFPVPLFPEVIDIERGFIRKFQPPSLFAAVN
jgi:hypothetical protein